MTNVSTLYDSVANVVFLHEDKVSRVNERSGTTWRLSVERETRAGKLVTIEIMPGELILTLIMASDFCCGFIVEAIIDNEKSSGITNDLGEWVCVLPESYENMKVLVSGEIVFLLKRVLLAPESLTPLLIEPTQHGALAMLPEISEHQEAFDGTSEGLATAFLALLDSDVPIERGRTMKQRDLLRSLRKLGCTIDLSRGKGSHRLAKNGVGTVPIPDQREIRIGTLTNIIKTLGYTYEQVKST